MAEQATLPAKPRPSDNGALAPFNRLRDEIDRLFEDVRFPTPARSIFSFADERRLLPAMELSAANGGYRLTVELPGMEQKDIDVQLADGILTVSGEKRQASEKKKEGYLMSERRYGSFRRQLTLPVDVDPGSITADFAHGVLEVRMKKDAKAADRTKKIKIG
jgi:HSP20 family protein